jgi:hypothetical protein
VLGWLNTIISLFERQLRVLNDILGIVYNLTPLIPPPSQGEGEETLERGEAPLLPALPLPLLREGG